LYLFPRSGVVKGFPRLSHLSIPTSVESSDQLSPPHKMCCLTRKALPVAQAKAAAAQANTLETDNKTFSICGTDSAHTAWVHNHHSCNTLVPQLSRADRRAIKAEVKQERRALKAEIKAERKALKHERKALKHAVMAQLWSQAYARRMYGAAPLDRMGEQRAGLDEEVERGVGSPPPEYGETVAREMREKWEKV
jgi:hypothetical protein